MKIVCLGDSLTKGYGVKASQAWPVLISKGANIEVINKGINGDSTGGMLARFREDVINNHPTHVVILGGINDLTWNVSLSVIEANVAAMVHQANHNNIVPVLGTPVPIVVDIAQKEWGIVEDFHTVAQVLTEYREWILEFADAFRVKVIDFYHCFKEVACQSPIDHYFIDGLHPTAMGHEMMYLQAKADLKL